MDHAQSIADLHIGLGGQSGLDDLHASYGLALEALSSLFLCPERLFCARTTCVKQGKNITIRPKGDLLIQHAMRRDSEGTFALLDELFDENIARRKLNLEMTRLFLYALLDTAFKIENAMNIVPDSATQNPVAMVPSCASIDEARTQVKFIYGMLCDRAATRKAECPPQHPGAYIRLPITSTPTIWTARSPLIPPPSISGSRPST
jgi:hypothetical protein